MRFFTSEWATGELSDKAFELVSSTYEEHLLQLTLPVGAQRLAATNLHDALVRQIEASANELEVRLTTGDLPGGYHLTTITYTGSESPLARPDLLRAQSVEATNEVLADELDRTEHGLVHRLLFADGSEVHIHFSDVSVSHARLAARDGPVA